MLYVDKIILFIGWLDFNVNYKMAPTSSKYQVSLIPKKRMERALLVIFISEKSAIHLTIAM